MSILPVSILHKSESGRYRPTVVDVDLSSPSSSSFLQVNVEDCIIYIIVVVVAMVMPTIIIAMIIVVLLLLLLLVDYYYLELQ